MLGALTIAWSSIFVKLSHASPSTAAIFRCAYALPLLLLLALVEDRRYGSRSWRDRRAAIAAGVFLAIDLIFWHHSIDDVGAGLATVLANIQVVFVPLVAWMVLSEHPGRRVLVALPVTLLGVLLISGVLEHGAYGSNPRAGRGSTAWPPASPMSARCCSCAAAASICAAPPGRLFDMTLTSAIVASVIGAVWGDARFIPVWPGAGWLITLALTSQVLGWMLITISLPRLPAALTSLLLMIQPIGSLILGAIIFGESPSTLQLLGVLVVLGAVVFATRRDQRKRSVRALSKQRADPGAVLGAHVLLGAADQHHRLRGVLAPREVGGRRQQVGHRDHGRVHLAPRGVHAPAPVIERRHTRKADRDVALTGAPRAPEGVGDHDPGRDPGQLVESAP